MSTWAVWRDAGGNLGVSAYPDVQLARYSSKALGRVVLDVRATSDKAHARRRELAARFAVWDAAEAAMREIDEHAGRRLS